LTLATCLCTMYAKPMVIYANDNTERSTAFTDITTNEMPVIILDIVNPSNAEINVNAESELSRDDYVAYETQVGEPVTSNDEYLLYCDEGTENDVIIYAQPAETGTVIINDEDESVEPKKHLTATGGVFYGPSGKETYYNLKMNRVVQIMRDLGYSEEEYPYWVREDGCKMLGDYIMIAAELSSRPKGTILETSLGLGIVCDTGDFAKTNSKQIDIATNW